MTYKQIITLFEKATQEEPTVNSFYYADTGVLDRQANIDYPAVVLTAVEGERLDGLIDRFGFTLTYVDRFGETLCQLDIHSAAFSTLKDIVNRMRSYNTLLDKDGWVYSVGHKAVNFYTGVQFADALTGAWIEVEVEAEAEPVGESFYDGEC